MTMLPLSTIRGLAYRFSEFSDAILHRAAHFDYDAPSDEELSAPAREVSAMLDRDEGEVWMVDTFRFRS